MGWLRSFLAGRAERSVPLAEPMEPRLLYSADVAAGLMLAAGADPAGEVRTLTDAGEYATAAAAQVVQAAPRLAFEQNQGQAGSGVDYVAAGSGYGIELAGGNATLKLADGQGARSVGLTLEGAAQAAGTGEDLQPGRSNYVLGSDPSQWHTGIANYGSVLYHDVYAGVDVRYYGTQGRLEYGFLVAPGANADAIRLRFGGVDAATVADNGDLLLQVAGSDAEVRFHAPVSWQRNDDGSLRAVASRYVVHADGSIGFALGAYDATRALVIDPVLDYASYFGDSGAENAMGVATDAAGNVYVTGRTTSTSGDLAPLAGGSGGSGDIYVAKFSPDLSTLLWATRIGGTGDEQGNAIAVDANGNVAVAGWTKSNDFPDVPAILLGPGGGQQAVVFKLDASGALVFADGFDGSAGTDSANAVGFDGAGNVYAAGQISSTGALGGLLGSVLGSSDNAFVEKFSSSGTVAFQQQFGGGSTEGATGLAVGSGGDVYVVGNTSSSDFQTADMTSLNGRQAALSGTDDGFLVHLDATGGTTLYGTYVGGTGKDSASAVAIDGSGKAYVVGQTFMKSGITFTTTAGAFMTSSPASNKDTGYLRVYDTGQTGSASLAYSSYLGGSQTDTPTGVAYVRGHVIIGGAAGSNDFPVTADAYQATNSGNGLFLVSIDPAGGGSTDLQYGTFYGNNMTLGGMAMAGDHAILAATVNSSGLSTAGTYQTSKGGSSDALLVSFTAVPNTAPVLSGVVQPPAVQEDSTGGSGFLVSSLIAGQVSDPDPSAVQGIAITAADNANGTWQYSVDGGTSWSDVGAPSTAASLLLAADAQTRLRFVPAANYAGTVSAGLTVRAWDRTTGTAGGTANTGSNGGMTAFSSATASVDMTVAAVNDPPVRTAGSVSGLVVAEDAPATNLSLGGLNYGPGGGTDEAAQVLTYTVTAVPSAALGNIVLADNTVVTAGTSYSLADLRGMKFVAAADANGGPATFSWTVRDDAGGSDTLVESLAITVTPVDDAPVAMADTLAATEDTPVTFTAAQLLGNDTDVEGDPLTIDSVVSVSGGTVLLNGDGSVTFTPAADFNGAASFKYKATDGVERSGFATVTINVAPVNDAPVAVADTLAATEDQAITYTAADLLGNDVDVDGDALTIASVTNGTGGTAVLNGDGTVTFTPGANFNGAADFTYTVSDGTTTSAAAATVTVNVAPVNDAPVANADTLAADEDVPATYSAADLLGNDTDVDVGDTLRIASVTSGAGGTVVLNGDGTFTFTSAANFNGLATFTYTTTDGTATSAAATVTVNVAAVNDAPVANADTLAATEDQAITYTAADLLGNDTDVEGDAIAIAGVTSGAGGTAVLNGDGTVTFTPDADFNGAANFTYTVKDGSATSADGSVTVNVAPVNDAPRPSAGAVNDLTVVEGSGLSSLGLGGLAFDAGPANEAGQGLTYQVTAVPSGFGSIVLADGTTAVTAGGTYTLAQLQGMQFRTGSSSSGSGTFTFTVTDDGGTAGGGVDQLQQSLTVTVKNQAPTLDGLNALEMDEDPASNDGMLVADLVNGHISDPLNVWGVAVTAASDPNGSWDYSLDGGASWNAIAGVSDSHALLLGPDGNTRLRFVPAADYFGPAGGLSLRAWDQSAGTLGDFADTRVNGGETAFSAQAQTVAVTVHPVNDAPVVDLDGATAGQDATAAFTEQTPVAVAPAAVLVDIDSADLQSLTLTLGARPDGDGVEALSLDATALGLANGAGLGVSYTASTGVLSITGSASKATYESILRGVLYTNTSDAPSTANRTVTVVASDGTDASVARSSTITVTPVNDAPVAAPVTLPPLAEDGGPVTITTAQLLAGATDPEGDALGVSGVSASSGSLVDNLDGTWTFTPAANDDGAVTFTYTVSDGALGTPGTANLDLTPVNDAPVANADTVAAAEDVATTYSAADLLGNDTDVDAGDTLRIASVTSVSGGTAVLNADGTVTFTSAANYNGPASFIYTASDGTATSAAATVSVNVAAVNDAPVANDDTLAATEDQAITYTAADLLGNDTDVEGSPLAIASVTNGAGGTAVLNADGSVTFTSAANYNGVASFTYTVSDGTATSSPATVTVNVAAVNDAPVASDDTLAATEDQAITYTEANLLGNDTDVDGDALTIASVTNGAGGTAVLNADGTVTFTPGANYNGPASFSYTVTDGTVASATATVTVNVAAVNDAPVANADTLAATEDQAITYTAADLLGNDSDVEGSALTIASVTSGAGGTAVLNADGTVTFTSAANFNGPASFTYTVSDGTATSAPATVGVNVAAVNDAPVANADTLAATEDQAITYTAADLLGNDSDVEGDALTIASVTSGPGGTARLNADGTVTFTPNADFNGAARFTYTASDGAANSGPATATVNVAPVDDAPVARGDTLAATEDTPVTWTAAQLLGNDTDVEGDVLRIASVTGATGGRVVLNADGSVTFTPDANFNGAASFRYTASDGTKTSGPATVAVNVAAVNDAPVANADAVTATEDQAITYSAADLLANDTDVEGSPLAIASVTSGAGGTAVLNADGSVTFTPGADFNGAARFSYAVSDGQAGSAPATVTVQVAPVEDAPVPAGGPLVNLAIPEEASAVTTVAARDPDGPDVPLTYAVAGGEDAGLFVIDARSGQLSFARAPDFEMPADANRDNVYRVVVEVSDGTLAARQSFAVTVQDMAEMAPVLPTTPAPIDTSPAPAPTPAPAPAPAPSPAPASPPTPAPAAAGGSGASSRGERPGNGGSGLPGAGVEPVLATGAALGDGGTPPSVMATVTPVPSGAAEATSPALRAVVFDRKGVQLATFNLGQLALPNRFGVSGAGGAQGLEDVQRALRSSDFTKALDQLRKDAQQGLKLEQSVTVSVAGVSLGLSLVYVLWLIRGGVLMGSWLSALPAWRFLDPLPVLPRPDEEAGDEDDEWAARADDARHLLRGFG